MGLLKELEKAAESHEDKTIISLYLSILDALKNFKSHKATFFNELPNLNSFDQYGNFLLLLILSWNYLSFPHFSILDQFSQNQKFFSAFLKGRISTLSQHLFINLFRFGNNEYNNQKHDQERRMGIIFLLHIIFSNPID